MKTIGLIGGISWVSTVDYYRLINEGINERLGGLNFAQCIIYSFNYADIKRNNDAGDWDATFKMLSDACLHLENSGAEAILLCANTMHLVADRIEQKISVPLIHIASVTAAAVREQNIKKLGLLGTKFTMERDFFTGKLAQQGIDTIIPGEDDRLFIHHAIFEELGRGLIKNDTRRRFLMIIGELISRGAEGIILGCTEIPLLIQPEDVAVPVFDTTRIHAAAAVNFALA